MRIADLEPIADGTRTGARPLLKGIATLREVFDDIAAQAEKMFKAGVPVAEAQQRYAVPDKFKNFPVFAWGFTIAPAIAKLYGEWGK